MRTPEMHQPAHIQYQVSHPFIFGKGYKHDMSPQYQLLVEPSCFSQNEEDSPDHLEHL
jgi:hypothetical protein